MECPAKRTSGPSKDAKVDHMTRTQISATEESPSMYWLTTVVPVATLKLFQPRPLPSRSK